MLTRIVMIIVLMANVNKKQCPLNNVLNKYVDMFGVEEDGCAEFSLSK